MEEKIEIPAEVEPESSALSLESPPDNQNNSPAE
jgi:hypothetical protein